MFSMLKMFEFIFVFAISLLGVTAYIHYYFSGKVEYKQKEAESEYAKEVAKICKESFKTIIKQYTERPTSMATVDEFLDSVEKFWVEAISAQFKRLEILTNASRPRTYFHDTMLAFTSAIILLLLAGLFPYVDLTYYSSPLFITAIILIIIGIIRFLQLIRYL